MSRSTRVAPNRREFLTALAGAVVVAGAGGAVLASTRHASSAAAATPDVSGVAPTTAAPTPTHLRPVPPTPSAHPTAHPHPTTATHPVEKATTHPPAPGGSPFTSGVHQVSTLPGTSPRIAITVDDGYDAAVLGAFIQFARDSGVRLTFFPNGVYRAWTDHRAALLPLIEAGQVQLGNHTWSHPRLPKLTDAAIATELSRNDTFLRTTFGVDPAPYFRPPYGLHDARTDQVAANLGYHAITTWDGVFDDSSSHLTSTQLLANARGCFGAGRIVLGHANHPAVTAVYGELLEIIHSRRLQTVTLADVFRA